MEREDDLQLNGLTLLQDDGLYCFTGDAVLLADFARTARGETALDFGAGSGIVAILLAAKRPSLRVIGFEIQGELYSLAVRNAERNKLSDRVSFLHLDLRNADGALEKPADCIVCNPPYFRRNANLVNESLSKARGRHEIDVTVQELCRSAAKCLKSGGRFTLCYPADRFCELAGTLRENRLEPKRIREVCVRAGDAPHLFLVEARKDGGTGAEFLPPLFLFEGNNESREVIKIYGRKTKEEE